MRLNQILRMENIIAKELRLLKSLKSKLFNNGVVVENYTKEKAIEVINRCCGVAVLTYIFKKYESEIVKDLKKQKDYLAWIQ